MKIKLDENLGTRTQALFADAGHDVHTVRQEDLGGASDQRLFKLCSQEDRCLITLDLDFSNVLRFPPEETGGIVVLRLPRTPTLSLLRQVVEQLLRAIEESPVGGKLWIVETNRIRIHQSRENDE